MKQQNITNAVAITTFYKFTPVADCDTLREALLSDMHRFAIQGTIILAPEGINATIAGRKHEMQAMLQALQAKPDIGELETKWSYDTHWPFDRKKVKIRPELISLRLDEGAIDCTQCVGEYVASKDWNAIISRDDVLTIDTRKSYEYRIGRFKGAVNPQKRDFKSMVAFTEHMLDPTRHRAIAMYCTGGIRCEKYSSYLLSQGFDEVYHLKGGILQYLEDIPEAQSLWQGSCYVFDQRIALRHDLSADTEMTMCPGCGEPLQPHDREHPLYIANEFCGYCPDKPYKKQHG